MDEVYSLEIWQNSVAMKCRLYYILDKSKYAFLNDVCETEFGLLKYYEYEISDLKKKVQ